MDEVFKALGDPTRLRILNLLARNGETCVCVIVDELQLGQSAVSHHMAALRHAGLLRSRRQGQWIHYSLQVEALKSGPLACLAEMVSHAEATHEMRSAVLCS